MHESSSSKAKRYRGKAADGGGDSRGEDDVLVRRKAATGSSDDETASWQKQQERELVELMESAPSLSLPQLSEVFEAVAARVEEAPDAAMRDMLLELIVTMCEECPKAARKIKGPAGEKGNVPKRVIPLCAAIASAIEGDQGRWASLQDSCSDGDGDGGGGDDGSTVGETALWRITRALGLRHSYSAVSVTLSRLLASSRWQDQHAGLRIMGNFLELTGDIKPASQLAKHRSDVVSTLCRFSSSSLPQVRAACYYAVAQLFYYHGGDLDDDHIARLLLLILDATAVSSNPSPRVRCSALEALSWLLESTAGFLDRRPDSTAGVLQALTRAISDGPTSVQELSVTALTSLAERAAASQVTVYYDDIMPVLIRLLEHAKASSLELLWGRTLDCCAVVGESAGEERFRKDATEIFGMLAALQQSLGDEFDRWEGKKYFLRAWVGVSRCLGAEVLPHLHGILARLFAALSQDAAVGIGAEEDIEGREGIEFIEGVDGVLVAARTAVLEEQAAAAQLLYLVVEHMRESFYPYVEQAVRCIAPLLGSPHDDVRSYCLAAVPEIVRCTAAATAPDRRSLKTLSDFLLGALLRAVETETSMELLTTGLQALKATLHYSSLDWAVTHHGSSATQLLPPPEPSHCLVIYSPAQLAAVSSTLKLLLRASIQRRAVLRAEAQLCGCRDEDDEDDERTFMMGSLDLYFSLAEVLGVLVRTHGVSYYPVFVETWHETLLDMAPEGCLREDRELALSVICDVVECGLCDSCAPTYLASVLPLLIGGCADVDSGLRQMCCYGLGAAATDHPRSFSAYSERALVALRTAAAMGAEGGDGASDNAIAALGYALEGMSRLGASSCGSTPFTALWPMWLNSIPLVHDTAEGVRVVRQLVSLLTAAVEGGSSYQLLPSAEPDASQRLLQCIIVLVSVHGTERSDAETDVTIAEFLRKDNLRAGLVDRLSAECRGRLERIVYSVPSSV